MGFEQWQRKNSGFGGWQRENVAVAEPPAQTPLPGPQYPGQTPRDIRVSGGTGAARPDLTGVSALKRAGKQFVNKVISDPLKNIAKRSNVGMMNQQAEYLTTRKRRMAELGVNTLPREEELRLQEEIHARAGSGIPSFDVPPPASKFEQYAIDTPVGIAAFVAKLWLAKQALGTTGGTTEGMLTWEMLNLVEGQTPGKGALVRGALGAIEKVPTTSLLGKGAKITAGGGLFGGLTAAEGGSFEDIAVSAAIGGGFQAWGIHKQTQWLKSFKGELLKAEKAKVQGKKSSGMSANNQRFQQDMGAARTRTERAKATSDLHKRHIALVRNTNTEMQRAAKSVDKAMDVIARKLHHGKLKGKEPELAKKIVEKGLTPESVAEVGKVKLPATKGETKFAKAEAKALKDIASSDPKRRAAGNRVLDFLRKAEKGKGKATIEGIPEPTVAQKVVKAVKRPAKAVERAAKQAEVEMAKRPKVKLPVKQPPQQAGAARTQPSAAERPIKGGREGGKVTKAQRQHKAAVEQLFKKGKPVAQDLRDMYPDLVGKYEKTAPAEAKLPTLENQGKLGFFEEETFIPTEQKEIDDIVSQVAKNESPEAAKVVKSLLDKGIQTESTHDLPGEIIIGVSNLSNKNRTILEDSDILVDKLPPLSGEFVHIPKPAPTEAAKELVGPKPTAAKVRKAKALALAAETGKKTLYEKETPPAVQEFLRKKHNLAPLSVTKDTKDAANVMDAYFAEGDDQIAQAKVEGIRLQKRVKEVMKSRKFGSKQMQADMAIQVYIDLKNNPEQVEKYYSKLSKQQKSLVDLAQNLPAELKAIADDIIKLNKEIGLNALDKGIIGNVIENYSMRLWEGTKQKDRPLFRKFGTKTARAKHRTLEGILHGWSLGKKLRVKGATSAHVLMRTQVGTTIVDRQLLKTAKQWGLVSNQQHENWVKIEHPNFTDWRWAGKADDAKTYGRNFFVTDDGNLMERVPMYAEPVLGKHLNNALGTSKLYSIPGVKALTEWNAILKRWILFSSFFHHQAYLRSYMLGAKTGLRNLNPQKAYKAGRQAIENYTPDFQRGVRNGLTVGLMQDFDEVSRSKISVFGRMLNHVPVAGHVAKGINALRMKNEDWLFGKIGPFLKVQAYLLEYTAGVKKYEKALKAGTITLDDIAATAAKLANDDFGGLHLRRMGRNPTLQHIFRLLALAPDWTESNVRSAVKAFKLGEEGRVYRAFWARIAAKGLLALVFFNYIMSLFDDEKDFVERYQEAWKNGKMRWMDIDITPLYRAMGGKADKQKYFSLFGHFKDPAKFLAREKFKEPVLKDVPDPVRSLLKSAKYKGSVITRIFADGITGKDWKGSEFTTILELLGTDDKGVYATTRKGHYQKGDPKGGKLKGELTKWSMGGVKPLGLEQVPSFLIYEAKAATPIQVQNGIHYLLGQMDGFDAVLKGLGAHMSSTYDPAEQYQGKSVSELKTIRKEYVYARTSRKLGQIKGKPHVGKERMVESLDKMIKEQR